MAELKLTKPFDLDGEQVETISYDVEGLTGNDIERAITKLGEKGIVIAMVETDQRYHAMLFSIAAGMSYEDVLRLPVKDFQKAATAIRDFFLAE